RNDLTAVRRVLGACLRETLLGETYLPGRVLFPRTSGHHTGRRLFDRELGCAGGVGDTRVDADASTGSLSAEGVGGRLAGLGAHVGRCRYHLLLEQGTEILGAGEYGDGE